MKLIHDGSLSDSLERLGIGLGFFSRYADSFWKATGMELDMVCAESEPWESLARRVKSEFCRNLALNPPNAELCRGCFVDAFQRAKRLNKFHTVECHAGQSFSVRSFGEVAGVNVLLIAGRVSTSDLGQIAAECIVGNRDASPPVKSAQGYQAGLELLDLTWPYLRIRLDLELLLAAREFPPFVRRACDYVDECFREDLSVVNVAAKCGVSEDYLSHSFSKHTGNSLSRYIAGVRTGHAMYLLREEQPTITEIAFEVGFQSLSQFNRTFRALTGMAPGEFRRKELGAFVK
jgi:AraC-like DNA-binding protein/ribosomal protein L40E